MKLEIELKPFLFQWAKYGLTQVSSMKSVEELEKDGFKWIKMHPYYENVVLMKKELTK